MKCTCDVRNDAQVGHFKDCDLIARRPTPIDIFDTSLASLRNLWVDSPETFAMVVHAVGLHDDLVAALYRALDAMNSPNDLEKWINAKSEIVHTLDRADGRHL